MRMLNKDEEDAALTFNAAAVAELVQSLSNLASMQVCQPLESFLLCEVIETGVASDFVEDFVGHIVEEGQCYAKVSYSQKYDKILIYVKYEQPRKHRDVQIRIAEIFATNINLGSTHVSIIVGDFDPSGLPQYIKAS